MTSTAVRRRETSTPRDLRITNWPLRDDGPWAMLAVTLVLAVALGAMILSASPATGLLALLALVLAMWRLWIPVTFEFSPHGMTQEVLGRRRRIAWRSIGGYRVVRRGVWLLPHASELRIAAPRSLFVRGGPQLDTLLAVLAFYLGPPMP